MVPSEFWDMDTGCFITAGCGYTLTALGALFFPIRLHDIFLVLACANIGVGMLLYGTRVAAERAHCISKFKELIKKSNDLYDNSFRKNTELYISGKITRTDLEILDAIYHKDSFPLYKAIDELKNAVRSGYDHCLSIRLSEIEETTDCLYRRV